MSEADECLSDAAHYELMAHRYKQAGRETDARRALATAKAFLDDALAIEAEVTQREMAHLRKGRALPLPG